MSTPLALPVQPSTPSGGGNTTGGARGDRDPRGDRARANGPPREAVVDPLQDIAQQLALVNKSVTHNTAAFATQRENIALQRADTEAHTQALDGLDVHFRSLQSTFETEVQALGSTFTDCFSDLSNALHESYEASAAEHQRLIDTIQRYVPAK